MNTAIVNVRVDPQVKKKAQKVASDLGLSLSALISGYLKQVVRTKSVTFSVKEEPNEYMIKALKEAKEDVKAGRVSPAFANADDAISWLNNPKRKYANQLQQKVHKAVR